VGPLSLVPLTGIPEVRTGDDVAALVVRAAAAVGCPVEDGDVLVVSSKVVSKALGLWAADREAAIRQSSTRVVAERRTGAGVTQIVRASAGPVMAAAGVDASNTGGRDEVLVLPGDPDNEAERLRQSLLALTGLTRVAVVVSDTAGRPWRFGQTDFALGAAGVQVVDDLRGGVDADGAPLNVTARALADELAAAADLVKGKADAVPAAIVRGSGWALPVRGEGAAVLLRTGRDDWFDYGRAEAVRAALGVEPGSAEARAVGIASVMPEAMQDRLARGVAVALQGARDAGVDLGGEVVRVSAPTAYELGVAVTRLQLALWGEGLRVEAPHEAAGLEVTLRVTER
jgi:coenzyme F420-0:L-glutamate ligase/coenzyme F420-1:gamma-L-glutamate ligase